MATHSRQIVAAVSLGLLLAACGKSPEEKAAELAIKAATGNDATIERDGDATKMTVKTDQGPMTVQSGESLSVPADFPADVYLPSGYTVKNVMQIGPMRSVVLALPGTSQALVPEITGKMETGGWKTAMSMQSGDQGAMISFNRDKRSATYSLAPGDKPGQLTLSVQHSSEGN